MKTFLLMIFITSSEIPSAFTVSVLLLLATSTFHSEIPSVLLSSDSTFATQLVQLRFV